MSAALYLYSCRTLATTIQPSALFVAFFIHILNGTLDWFLSNDRFFPEKLLFVHSKGENSVAFSSTYPTKMRACVFVFMYYMCVIVPIYSTPNNDIIDCKHFSRFHSILSFSFFLLFSIAFLLIFFFVLLSRFVSHWSNDIFSLCTKITSIGQLNSLNARHEAVFGDNELLVKNELIYDGFYQLCVSSSLHRIKSAGMSGRASPEAYRKHIFHAFL